MTGWHIDAAGCEYGVCSPKRLLTHVSCRRILVAHSDRAVGDSLALLFGIKGFAAIHGHDMSTTGAIVRAWQPQAVLFDTRLVPLGQSSFIRGLHDAPENESRLLLAMSGAAQFERVETLRRQGFDGYCRQPCPLWHLAELLSAFFAPLGEA
jgi:DNA-binding response OmpR family regulator